MIRLEAGLEPPFHEGHRALSGHLERRDPLRGATAKMLVKQFLQPHSGPLAGHGNHHRAVLAVALGSDDLRHFGDHTLAGAACARQNKAGAPASIIACCLIRRRKRHQPHRRREKRLTLRLGRIQAVRRQRTIGHAGVIIPRFLPRPVKIRDLRIAGADSGVRLMVQHHPPAGAVICQQPQLFMKKRQPMFHPGMHAAGRDGFIQGIAACHRAKGGAVPGAKPFNRRLVKLEFRDRAQHKLVHGCIAALRCRIKAADGLQLITKEIQPYRHLTARRENIKNAATKREFTGLADRIGTKIPLPGQKITKPRRTGVIARDQNFRAGAEIPGWRHALQNGIHRGQQQSRSTSAPTATVSKPGQRFNPLPDKRALRRQPVIGKTIPGRKHPRVHIRGQTRHRITHGNHARIVTGDKDKPLTGCEPGLKRQH